MNTITMRSLSVIALLIIAESALAQQPPAVTLGAPVPAETPPVPAAGPIANLPIAPGRLATSPPFPDAGNQPSVPFLGARYSFYEPRSACPGFSYYGPGYVAPQFFNPRYPNPGPYYYSPAYPYAQSYYSYYYTPGFFRY